MPMPALREKAGEAVSREFERIFDAFMMVSAEIHRKDEQRRELARLRESSRDKCGNCHYWMKSSDCPREKNVGGRRTGPSMNAPICSKFTPDSQALEWREQYRSAFQKAGVR